MKELNDILFREGDYNKKKAYIDNMLVDELVDIQHSLIKSIIEKCGDVQGIMWIRKDFRQGNHWNSEVEAVSLRNGRVLVFIYVQDTDKDATYKESFDVFFRRGEYYSKKNILKKGVDYTEGQKAEVMRSILFQCIYVLHSDEKKKSDKIAELSHYTIINPIIDYFYNRLLTHDISKYSPRNDVAQIMGYNHAKKALQEYIESNYISLSQKTTDELMEIYKVVFKKDMDEFAKNFDYNAWRENNYII